MAEAISAARSIPVVDPTAGQGVSQADPTSPAAAADDSQTPQPDAAAAPYPAQYPAQYLTPNPPATMVQVAAQLAATDIGPEGRLMQLLRALNPPVPPPIVPPAKKLTA